MVEPTFQIKTDFENNSYGKFIIEPLEKGYGQTLGNSLRRVLLTSLEGAAIQTVKIEGVKHQFSTLPGLKEDIIEFCLNLKKVRLIIHSNETVRMTLEKKGSGSVKAADIEVPSGVEIVNPELELGTLSDRKAVLSAQITAGKGYGYVKADEIEHDEVGVIPLDALYAPIPRVNYRVEATRVGRMTNLDRLVMEVWSDGTVKPMDALHEASKILVSYYTQIIEPKETQEKLSTTDEPVLSDDILKMRIEEIDIPTRIVNALANGGIETIGQLVLADRSDLMKIKNLGAKSLSIVEEKLKDKNITL